MKAICRALLSLLCLLVFPVHAQDEAKQPWEEYDKLVKGGEEIAALGPTLFGDQVNLMNGALSFSTTDVSAPGNSASLPMAVTRTYTVSNRKGYRVNDLLLADWDLDLPRISGVFSSTGTGGGFGTPCTATTATQAMPPQMHIGSSFFSPADYWQGNQASMPGGGEMLLANAGAPGPSTGGPYYWMTSEFTYFSCLATIKNGAGEGFLAVTKDGTKYWFDWMASYQEPDLKSGKGGSDIIPRSKRVLYATRVQDRFGNTVTYTFTNASQLPARLTRIDGSDGRAITLTYNTHGHVASVRNGVQNVTYQYRYPSEGKGTLTEVTWPDKSEWKIDFTALTNAAIRYEKPKCASAGIWGQICDPIRSCGDPGIVITPGATGTITHPSGAQGEFTVQPTRHGRSNVPMVCSGYTDPNNDPNDDTAYYPLNYDALSVVNKRVTGPSLAPSEWTYTYGADIRFAEATGPVCTSSNCGAVVCTSDTCAGAAVTVLTGPDGLWERHTFGNSYRYNEGKLLKIETGTGPGAILKTVLTAYQFAQSGLPFAAPIGRSPQPRGDGFTSEYLRPQLQKTIFQDEASFTSLVTGFDAFARPLGVTRSSSLGYTKTDATEYHDDAAKWVVGQVKRQINADNGEVMSRVDYAADTALPVRQYQFGQIDWTLAYHPDGTLASAKDGRENPTVLQGWKRGVPTTIGHADGSVEGASVDANGWIDSVVDENGYRTMYRPDDMGRPSLTVFPSDTPGWNAIHMKFRASSRQWGLPGTAWYQTTSNGPYEKEQFYDGLWRPVFEIEWDTSNPNTKRFRSRAFDALGREAFVSYPSAIATAYNSLAKGTRTYYDILGRVIRTEQDSEQGPLITRTEYLPGFQRRITNPRGQSTLQQFQAYDEPSYDAPVRQESPEGVTTTIVRDRYLKPLEVTRSGPEG